jgi:hypothetical protein
MRTPLLQRPGFRLMSEQTGYPAEGPRHQSILATLIGNLDRKCVRERTEDLPCDTEEEDLWQWLSCWGSATLFVSFSGLFVMWRVSLVVGRHALGRLPSEGLKREIVIDFRRAVAHYISPFDTFGSSLSRNERSCAFNDCFDPFVPFSFPIHSSS